MKLRLRSGSKKGTSRKELQAEETVAVVAAPVVNGTPENLIVKELSVTFAVFDRNADGRISKAELGDVLSSLGEELSELELDELMAKVDGDGDGYIDLGEFISFHTEKRSGRAGDDSSRALSAGGDGVEWSEEKRALLAAFDVFDVDKDGYICAEELRRVMCSLGDEHTSLAECRHMISCVDKDGDQKVDFSEFQCLMMSGAV
ncbi:hypothetical protein M758_1G077400 [Ceratodon purpureus]|uniref:EF-hand domain-containing protein n=1 Tax=Ceratodon purpureus TaxID=3225 RepID=A0A8T0J3Q1_CERPU|nr:hypothetical protein KC19_1G079200 [Ceratodon purpureus]KAG0629112.1 hypothetical protein M758_1G077400 [Ceratodon purpureus]